MNRFISTITLLAAAAFAPTVLMAQSTSPLTVEVTAITGVSTQGLTVELFGEDSGWVFDPVKVKADGTCKFQYVPDGVFTLVIDGSPLGLETYTDTNLVHSGEQTVSVLLNEAVRTPYALQVALSHDEFAGTNYATVSWNQETDYFFDDFESYEPFAVQFEPWTGHDLDKEPAAEIQGGYPNRGTQQYATIFNALTIDPPVYYEYEVLRPYSGKQYVGFVRTRSGNANNDWLISPKIKVGVDNVVSLMAKAADYTPERFSILVSTTGTDPKDFVSLTSGNYQTVDYRQWNEITYSLAKYEGQEVYIAIHCVSQNGFMLMIDDFYVGPKSVRKQARRVSRHSAANPNETFTVTLDGNEVGTTEEYSFSVAGITGGNHIIGVRANYLKTQSDEALISVDVPDDNSYASLTVKIATDTGESAAGMPLRVLNTSDARQVVSYADENGVAAIPSLAKGDYMLNINAEYFTEYNSSLYLAEDTELEVTLAEEITDPFNVLYQTTALDSGKFDVEFWWNQDLGFRDSFEDYGDFEVKFGDWTVLDLDGMPTYAFSIGGTNITWPIPREPIGAMIFNPFATKPVQASEDGLFIAPDGIKYVAFNSAEQAASNDWLISPTVRIGKDYVLRFSAKSYSYIYPGAFEFCALKDKDIANPTYLDAFNLTEDWMRYEISLKQFEGDAVEIGFHHTTVDGWLSFLDDIYIGPGDETHNGETAEGRCSYDVYLDKVFFANVEMPNVKFTGLEKGNHVAGIQAVYPSGKKSELVETLFTADATGVVSIDAENAPAWRYFTVDGIEVPASSLSRGLYIRTDGTRSEKIIIR